jgi:hypothetical protein
LCRRFIGSALRERACAFTCAHSNERAEILDDWTHHYNWHRRHHGIGRIAPMTRIKKCRKTIC